MKFRPVGAELLHTGSQTDGQINMNLIVAFRSFSNVPKNIRDLNW